MKSFLLAAALLATPAFGHGNEHHDKAAAKEHANAPTSFDKQPAAGTWAKCPVSGDVFKVDKDTQFATYNGRVYAFCCEDCKPDFDKNPQKYADKK